MTQLVPNLGLYGELGLGLGIVHTSVSVGGFSASDTSLSFIFKIGGGVEKKIDEKMSVTGGIALNYYSAGGAFQELTFMAGVLYKI